MKLAARDFCAECKESLPRENRRAECKHEVDFKIDRIKNGTANVAVPKF